MPSPASNLKPTAKKAPQTLKERHPMHTPHTRQCLTQLDTDATAHFLALARQGMRAGSCASRGEQVAFTLLSQLEPLAHKLAEIDTTARAGFVHLAQALADPDAHAAAAQLLPRPKL